MPDIFRQWPTRENLTPEEVVDLYDSGFAGALPATPEVEEELATAIESTGGVLYGADAATASGFADSYAGKLVPHFVHVERIYPGCWPGPAQARGSCVVHNGKNARLFSHVMDIIAGTPDEKTGLIEGPVEITTEGIKNGVFSTEAPYWFRGYDGDGWYCGADAAVAIKQAGCVIRKNYPEIGIDLTKYSGSLEGKYGRKAPPAEVRDAIDNNLIYTATKLGSFEEVRDFLGNGYGVSSCGSEGFSSTRDANGVSGRKGSWAHAMAIIGADDRPEIHQKYGGPLVLVLNSWGRWNSGPRRILGTEIDIPEGAFWARWKDVSRREFIAFSGVAGWPARTLPDYSPGAR